MSTEITVLHVDDSEALLDITAELLERVDARMTVISEPDPIEAIDRIDGDDIDCVVSDYAMPGMDGLELCRRIREDSPHLPLFLFSSNGGTELIDEAFAVGATDYIQKDPGITQFKLLANRIRNAVGHHETLRRHDEVPDTA